MQAGKLRKRMTIQQRDMTVNSAGAQATSWADVFTAWVEITPTTGAELFYAGAEQGKVTHTIVMRFRAELANPLTVAAYRGVYKGRYFNFAASVNEDERNRQIMIAATEGLAVG